MQLCYTYENLRCILIIKTYWNAVKHTLTNQLIFVLNLLFDTLGILPQSRNSNSATVRRFFADLSKESVAKQVTIGGVTGWSVYYYMLLFHICLHY